MFSILLVPATKEVQLSSAENDILHLLTENIMTERQYIQVWNIHVFEVFSHLGHRSNSGQFPKRFLKAHLEQDKGDAAVLKLKIECIACTCKRYLKRGFDGNCSDLV